MPIFLLIRHGETDYNKKRRIPGRISGVHLNKKGRKQAQTLADHLAQVPIKAIYASPLERTIETAEPLAGVLNLEITPMPGLLETDCGDWQGQSIGKLRRLKAWRSLAHHPSLFRFPGGESIVEGQYRIVQVIEALRQKHAPGDLIACFSHSDPLKLLVAYYLGLPLDQFQRLTVGTASITVLQVNENVGQLILLNHSLDFSWELFKQPVKNVQQKGPSIAPSA
jgi:probable phosphoglycerate mutase